MSPRRNPILQQTLAALKAAGAEGIEVWHGGNTSVSAASIEAARSAHRRSLARKSLARTTESSRATRAHATGCRKSIVAPTCFEMKRGRHYHVGDGD
jgi:hypothetical protein